MYEQQVTVSNPTGLHARTASDFIAEAKKYEAKITIARADDPDEEANAKSIVQLLGLGVCQGDDVVIAAKGSDEKAAVEALTALINSRFGE